MRTNLVDGSALAQVEDNMVPMEVKMPAKDEWVYYYALYIGLAQWAAYIAVLVLLLTIGFLLSTSQISTITHTKTAVSALLMLWVAEVYLVIRVIRLGNFVHEKLEGAFRGLELISHPYNHILTIIAATIVAFWDISLVLQWI